MPIYRACPKCGRLTGLGAAYCEQCRPMAEQKRREAIAAGNRRYNAARDPKYMRFYKSKEWRRLSAAKLNKNRTCEAELDGCSLIACEVHHIKPIKTPDGWAERLEWGNLMSVCVHCHNVLDSKWGKAHKDTNSSDDGVIDLSKIKKSTPHRRGDLKGGGSKSFEAGHR